MSSSLGVPMLILNDAIGTVVTVELSTGDSYRGQLLSVDDSMSIELKDITRTDRKGRTSSIKQTFLRGSNIVFFELPSELEHAAAARLAPPKAAAVSGPTRGSAAKRPRE